MSGLKQNTNGLMRAVFIKEAATEVAPSNAQEAELDKAFSNISGMYTPPYNLSYFLKLPEYSNILQECIDAYVNNIPGFGWEVVSVIDTNTQEKDNDKTKEAHTQKEEVEFLLKTCNYKESFTNLMKLVVRNRESCGVGYLEVLHNRSNQPAGFEIVRDPSKVRIIKPIDWVYKEVSMTLDSGVRKKSLPVRFYKFVLEDNGKIVYFKEFGDDRTMDKTTGVYGSNRTIKFQDRATSLILYKLPCSYSPYGLPRFIGKIPSIVGSRKSEELNIKYFESGRVVPAAIIVENGRLTNESYEAIQNTKGLENGFKWMLIEATGVEPTDSIIEGENDKNKVNIDIKPLTEMMQQDGLFQEYDANNRSKVRSSYRVPPIYTGESSDYTKSTAQIARAVAEALVFQPEREELAEPINRIIREMGYNLVELRFKAPKLTDKFELSKALAPYITSGTATPNMLLESLGELLGKRFDRISEDYGDKPIALILKEIDKEMIVEQAKANDNQSSSSGTKNPSPDKNKDATVQKESVILIKQLLKELKEQEVEKEEDK